jgi:hypothetical protein
MWNSKWICDSCHGHGSHTMAVQVKRLWEWMGNKIYELEPSAGHSVKPPKVKPKVQRKENPTLVPTQSNPSNLMAKILSIFSWFYEKIDGFSTIVWISNPVRLKLHLKVHHLGKKVLPCRHFGERRPLDFGLWCERSRDRILGLL